MVKITNPRLIYETLACLHLLMVAGLAQGDRLLFLHNANIGHILASMVAVHMLVAGCDNQSGLYR